jgi:c-di-GMP-binding flagellar brake protein YcgR
MADGNFKIQPEDVLQLQFFGDEARHLVRVIGYAVGQSVLVTTPRVKGAPMLLREGQPVTVRLMSGNTVYAFETQIVKAYMVPFPYVHLGYPKEFESMVVRKAQRATVHIIVAVENTQHSGPDHAKHPAIIADLSTSGALMESKEVLGKAGEAIVISTKLAVASIEKYVEIPALIRNIREKKVGDRLVYQHGVEFQLLQPDHQLVLHGFVYEQIAQGKVN